MTGPSPTTPSGLYEQLKDDLGSLKLTQAAELLPTLLDRAREEQLSHTAFLAELVAAEAAATRNRRMAARLGLAHVPARRTIEEFDFDFQPWVDRGLVDDLASLRLVTEGRPLLLLGQPGCGKRHLAIALATLAVEAGSRGYFTSAADLVASITTAYADGSFGHKLRTDTGPSVLVIDDVGLTPWTGPPATRCSRSSTAATTTTRPPSSPPTAGCPPGASCSATRWSPRPSWTGCSTGRWSSTSRVRAGACASTSDWSTACERGGR
jgi:DNA replication protein DnaC